MLEAIVIILRSGIEVALVIGLLLACLRQIDQYSLSLWVYGGVGAAAAFGGFIAYNMQMLGGREMFEGAVTVPGLIATVFLLFRVWRTAGKDLPEGDRQPVGAGLPLKAYLLLAAFFLVVIPAVNIALFPNNVFIQTYRVMNTELVLKISGGIIGLVVSYLFGLVLLKSCRKFSARSLAVVVTVTGTLFMLKQAVTLGQILFATGVLPLTSPALSVLIPFINNMDKFFYGLLGAAVVWFGIAAISHQKYRHLPSTNSNPAQRRKITAANRNGFRWLGAAAGALILVISLTTVHAVYANKTVELSQPVPVTAGDTGQIIIGSKTVNDGNLHRFSYTASDGTQVRFLVIRKSETSYGVGLDACEICGPVGYYQRKDQVVCRNCDVVINIPTIGFPGGCNPIPLDYQMKKGNLVLKAVSLENEKERFTRTDVFSN